MKVYDYRVLDILMGEIVETAKRMGVQVVGSILLLTVKNKYCVLRSPYVDKKSREVFEICTHKRLIDIFELTQQTVDALMKLDLLVGVDVEIKVREEKQVAKQSLRICNSSAYSPGLTGDDGERKTRWQSQEFWARRSA